MTCIHTWIHACMHPSVHPSIHPSIHASIYIQYNTIPYNTIKIQIQYNTIQYNTNLIQYNTIQYKYNTIQYKYNTVQYNTNIIQYSTNITQYNTNTIQYNAIQFNKIRHNTDTIRYNTIQHNTIQHNTTQYNTYTHTYTHLREFPVALAYVLCKTFESTQLSGTFSDAGPYRCPKHNAACGKGCSGLHWMTQHEPRSITTAEIQMNHQEHQEAVCMFNTLPLFFVLCGENRLRCPAFKSSLPVLRTVCGAAMASSSNPFWKDDEVVVAFHTTRGHIPL